MEEEEEERMRRRSRKGGGEGGREGVGGSVKISQLSCRFYLYSRISFNSTAAVEAGIKIYNHRTLIHKLIHTWCSRIVFFLHL